MYIKFFKIVYIKFENVFEISLEYCGMPFQMAVVGLKPLVEVCFWCAIKSAARKVQGKLPDLWCEADLQPNQWLAGARCTEFAAALLSGGKAARAAARTLANDDHSSGTILRLLKKQMPTLLLHDERFGIEAAWFKSVIGEPGGNIITAKVSAMLQVPEGQTELQLLEVTQRVEQLMKSGLFAFVQQRFQHEVQAVATWLKALRIGDSPKLPANTTEVKPKIPAS